MKKNAGFSLIELVVTIAVMAVLTAGTVSIILSQSGARCKKAAELLNSGLAETKSQALAKQGAWAELAYSAPEGYVLRKSFADDVVLGDDCEISYDVYDMGDNFLETRTIGAGSSDSLVISYNRASGELMGLITNRDFKSETVTKADGSTGQLTGYELTQDANRYCKRITIAKGTRYVYTIEFERVTGKHTLNK